MPHLYDDPCKMKKKTEKKKNMYIHKGSHSPFAVHVESPPLSPSPITDAREFNDDVFIPGIPLPPPASRV